MSTDPANHTIWGIHNDQAGIDPISDGAVRIGWDGMGDLSELPASRDAFKQRVAATMPEVEQKSIPVSGGTLYRFVHEIKVGDVVVSPNRKKRTLNIGRVSGAYQFHREADIYRHWRPVDWLAVDVSRDDLSEAAQNEISAATTLFTINTGREEIERVIAAPSTTTPDFTWTSFYSELADRILDYANDREVLLQKVWSVAEASGVSHRFEFLRGDHRLDGSNGPLRDVDPFTVFASFNRGIKYDARAAIAAAFGEEFGVTAPAPTQFPGVPVANNLKSWFIRFEVDRGPNDIDVLWRLANAAVAYAKTPDETTREHLVSSFDECPMGHTRLLTMGLYWMRPETFAAYDNVNVAFIKKELPEIATTLALGAKISGEQFLANTEALHTWLATSAAPYKHVSELSYAAWLDTLTTDDAKEHSGSQQLTDAPLAGIAEIAEEPGDPYDVASIREDGCFLPEDELQPMLERLRSKKNLVLQGPPGTGKTWLARRLGWALCNERDTSRVQILQFHPSLAYEDFVRGWRPSTSSTGGALTLEDGPFLQACRQASDDAARGYVLVIEEVNRGNPAQVLGELLTLIEADKRNPSSAMRLAYPRTPDERFHVPPNLHLIGTMNVADRSLAIVDMALRRRFAFIELRPRLDGDWVEYVSQLGYDPKLLEIYGQRVDALNQQISTDRALGRQYCVGHSYFTPAVALDATGLDTRQWWERVVDTDVRPLLEEYWFDRPELAGEAFSKLLGA